MDKIIRPWFGGLGDSLQFSTLPEEFTKLGYDVYISDQTPFRNTEIYDLVWGQNPFVKGLSDKEPNAGDIPGYVYENKYNDFIQNVEYAHGITPLNSYPKVYYTPKIYKELTYETIADISSISLKHEYDYDKIISSFNRKTIILTGSNVYEEMNIFRELRVNSIFQYCDFISSCKKFICLSSGGNVLASALGINADCLVQHTPTMDSMHDRKLFFFDNINYIWI